jgi:predicted MarR family transcription regulator
MSRPRVPKQRAAARSAQKSRRTAAPGRHEELNTSWYLSRNERETAITEFEFSLMRIAAAFDRWIAECLATVARAPLGSTCAEVLHLTCLKDRPKTPAEIARLLNRDDVPNVVYAIRKLENAGLVERVPSKKPKSSAYCATLQGRRVALDYASLRAEVLLPHVPRLEAGNEQLAGAKDLLDLIRGIYDQAALVLATHRDWRAD